MTTILGQQFENGFIIAADSQVTSGDRPYRHAKMAKISRVGYLWVAGAGHAAACDLIQNYWQPPKRKPDMDAYKEMVTSVAPSMKWALEKAGITPKEDEGPYFLVGMDNQLFLVEDLAVMVTDTGLYGIGSGSQYGIGALAAGATVRDAVEIASRFDIYTGGTIQVIEEGDVHGKRRISSAE